METFTTKYDALIEQRKILLLEKYKILNNCNEYDFERKIFNKINAQLKSNMYEILSLEKEAFESGLNTGLIDISYIKSISNSQWLIDISKCINENGSRYFTLDDMYEYVGKLRHLHPNNKHVNDKIRQQLQTLRNLGILKFIKPGEYQVI